MIYYKKSMQRSAETTKDTHYIYKLLAVCAAVLAASSCGKEPAVGAPHYKGSASETTAAVSSVTDTTTAAPELSVEEITDVETNSRPEIIADYRQTGEGTPEVAEIKLDKDSIDPKKPFTPDAGELGTGCTYYAYPMNSIILSVYQAPSPEAKRTGKALSGSEVTLLATAYFGYSDSWSYISFGDVRGWCRSRDITATRFGWLDFEGLQLPENCYDYADYSGGICDVLTDGTELRTAPDNGSEVRGHIKNGCTLRAFGETPSAKGWLFAAVSAEYLEEGGSGEVYGWVYTDGGKAVKAQKKG